MKDYNTSITIRIICKILVILIVTSYFLTALANAESDSDIELDPWSIMFYVGGTAKEVFIDAIRGKYSSFGETIYAAELAYTLDKKNLFRRIFSPVFDTVEIAGNLAYRHDRTHKDHVKEANLYIIWRFSRFPWRKHLRNSIAIGDGISYASHSPFADHEKGVPVNGHSKLLNYLMLEVTFALPKYPNLQLILRSHHRCTAWGTFPKNANAGSTNVGLGIRYYF
jgi:hypothetical protein